MNAQNSQELTKENQEFFLKLKENILKILRGNSLPETSIHSEVFRNISQLCLEIINDFLGYFDMNGGFGAYFSEIVIDQRQYFACNVVSLSFKPLIRLSGRLACCSKVTCLISLGNFSKIGIIIHYDDCTVEEDLYLYDDFIANDSCGLVYIGQLKAED